MEVILDGRMCTAREELHLHLKEQLHLPDYYGMNLDALYDCLTTISPVKVHLVHWGAMIESLGDYGQLVIQTMNEASEENPGFELVMEEDDEDDVEI